MKIAVINDTHFGARNDNKAFAEYFIKFYRDIFFPTIDEYDVKTVLHLGDLVDRRKYINYVTANHLEQEFIKPLHDRGIDTHIIVGNHDTSYKNTNEINSLKQLYANSSYREYLKLYWGGPVELEFDGCKIMLSPWICAENYDISMKGMKETNAHILMGHFEIQGFEMMKGTKCDHGFSMKMFDRFDRVYSGHFHHPSAQGNITYLGAPYEMTWTDFEGKRGFHIFDTETREMTFIPNPYRMFHKIMYSDEDMTIEDIDNLDTSLLTNTYIKVIIKEKNNPYIFDLFLDKIQDAGAADIKVVEDHHEYDSIDESELIDEAQDTITIMNTYISNMSFKCDEIAVKELMRELYQEAINL